MVDNKVDDMMVDDIVDMVDNMADDIVYMVDDMVDIG